MAFYLLLIIISEKLVWLGYLNYTHKFPAIHELGNLLLYISILL
jgi:hypothetical protein